MWGAREVRKLQAELAETTEHAAEILHERQAAVRKPRPAPQSRGIMAVPPVSRRERRRLDADGRGADLDAGAYRVSAAMRESALARAQQDGHGETP